MNRPERKGQTRQGEGGSAQEVGDTLWREVIDWWRQRDLPAILRGEDWGLWLGNPRPVPLCDLNSVVEEVAAQVGIGVDQLMSFRRNEATVMARRLAYLMCYDTLPQLTIPQLARRFGDRDPSTLRSGLCIARRLKKKDSKFAARYDAVRAALNKKGRGDHHRTPPTVERRTVSQTRTRKPRTEFKGFALKSAVKSLRKQANEEKEKEL